MKTAPVILFVLGCLGLAVGMSFGPTSSTGAAINLSIIALMVVVGFIYVRRRSA